MIMKKYVAYLIFAFAVMFILPSCENGKDVDFDDNTLTLFNGCNQLGSDLHYRQILEFSFVPQFFNRVFVHDG